MRRAAGLVGATAAYNAVEAGIALWSGIEANSIALVGFGLDSMIELAAAVAMLWRVVVGMRGAGEARIEQVEVRVHRFIGVTFLALALYVVGQAGWTLWKQDASGESLVGIVLAVASLIIMPVIAVLKLRAADRLGSKALRAEAKETLACAYLSFALLVGLGAHAILGWWWADPVAALLMVPWLVREGLEGLEGESDDDDD